MRGYIYIVAILMVTGMHCLLVTIETVMTTMSYFSKFSFECLFYVALVCIPSVRENTVFMYTYTINIPTLLYHACMWQCMNVGLLFNIQLAPSICRMTVVIVNCAFAVS